jgi:hypothetical protein
LLAQLEDPVGLLQDGHSHLGEDEPTSGRFQQRDAERALEPAHLLAHRLHGHSEPFGGPTQNCPRADDPEVVEVAVVERLRHGLVFPKRRFGAVCFIPGGAASTIRHP